MEDTGTLIVQVTTSRARLPVSGATVAVAARDADADAGGRRRLVALRETDESGRSGPIRLQVPASDDGGRTPGGPAPYSMYSLWVEHPEFQVEFVENFQVFPGIESVQQISLIPLNGAQDNAGEISAGGNAQSQGL